MCIGAWSVKWGVPTAALDELYMILRCENTGADTITSTTLASETGVQSIVKLEASRKGCRLWRNNVGALYTQSGDFIRFGLANESKQINDVIKSADLIGIRPLKITQEHVGTVVGQFLSREIKKTGWTFSGNAREEAQLRWAKLINSMGGDAGFATMEGTI